MPDVITYRYNGRSVYVRAARDYIDAISIAQQEFQTLAHVGQNRIALSISTGEGDEEYIRISQRVWTDVVSDLRPYQIIDITERQVPLIDDPTTDKIAVDTARKSKR